MQSACQITAYAHYARTPLLQLKQRTDDFFTACVIFCFLRPHTKGAQAAVSQFHLPLHSDPYLDGRYLCFVAFYCIPLGHAKIRKGSCMDVLYNIGMRCFNKIEACVCFSWVFVCVVWVCLHVCMCVCWSIIFCFHMRTYAHICVHWGKWICKDACQIGPLFSVFKSSFYFLYIFRLYVLRIAANSFQHWSYPGTVWTLIYWYYWDQVYDTVYELLFL
jgi:hypothetical protein